MAVDYFGAGVLFATPLYDASGNAVAIPSPVQFGIVQGVTIDDEAEVKELYGALGYPVDIGRGKQKISIKCQQAQVTAELFNAVYFGQTIVAGYDAVYNDLTGSVIPTGAGATSIHVTPTAPTGGTSTYVADLGVQDGNGVPYTRVASSPTSGQYALGSSAGGATYTFSDLDVGKLVFINYQYSNSTNPPTGKLLTINNLPMGQVPVFSAQFFNKRNGRTHWRKFPSCVATKLSMAFKNDDFVVPDFEISCFADPNTGIVQQFSTSE